MFSFDKNIELKDKIIVILTYVFICNFPLGVIVMFFMNRNDYPKLHFNRVFFCGFLFLFNVIANYFKIPISLHVIPSFVALVSLVGMLQATFGEKTQWFFFDRLKFIYNKGQSKNCLIQIIIPVIIFTISIFI